MVFQLKLLGADRELEVRGRWSCRDEDGLYSGVLDAEGEVNCSIFCCCLGRVGLLSRPL